MELITVDPQSCGRDGLCAAVCPIGIIVQEGDFLPAVIDGAENICIRCGHCVAVCPSASLRHKDIDPAVCTPLRTELALSWEQCEQFFRSRRSIRNYRPDTVDRETLDKLFDLVRYAPTGHNYQGVKWLVLGNRVELTGLIALVAEWMRFMIGSFPEMAKSLMMEHVLGKWERGEDVILRDAPLVVVAHGSKTDRRSPTSCAIALAHLELVAPVLGLGCCWAGFFTAAAANYPKMRDALGLPDGNELFGAMMVGYPRYRYHRLVQRQAPSIDWRL